MTRLESEKEIINKPAKEVFEFLSDFNNIGKMMPSQVVNFETEGDTCKFTITGMATLGLVYGTKTPYSEVIMNKNGKAPFEFSLICKMNELTAGSTELQLFFDADLNPLMKMMAEKPLTSFLNLLIKKYAELANATA